MARVTLTGVTKRFGSQEVLSGVDLTVEEGEFVVFVGPSGCGKSTLLRLIAGLEELTAGSIFIDDDDVSFKPAAARNVAMVFQSYALYPHMNVRQNMAFGMKINGFPKAEMERRIARAAEILKLEPYLDRRPSQLSGGQRQRVAIGRAIVKEPRVFLFDEPLSNLDAALRIQMRVELESLHRSLRTTMIYVTHDQVEAMTMADRIVVINEGRIEQVGAPLELYHRPGTQFVAGFIGSPRMNFLTVAPESAGGSLALHYGDQARFALPLPPQAAVGHEALTFGIRPEHLIIGKGDGFSLPAQVAVTERLGNETYVHAVTALGDRLVLRVPGDGEVSIGERIDLHADPAHCHLFRDGLRIESLAAGSREAHPPEATTRTS